MSSSIISNLLYNFIQDVEGMYIDYKRSIDGDYTAFYNYLDNGKLSDTEVQKAPEMQTMYVTWRKTLMYKVAELCAKVTQLKGSEVNMGKTRRMTLQKLSYGFLVIFLILTIGFVIGLKFIYNAYKNDLTKAIQSVLILIVVYLVVTTLYIMINNYFTYKINGIKREANRIVLSLNNYINFMNASIPSSDKLMTRMVFLQKKQGKKVSDVTSMIKTLKRKDTGLSDAQLKDDNKFLEATWPEYISKVVRNVHNGGQGTIKLNNIEMTSSNVKIMKSVNDVLSPYYNLMLKSKQNASTNEGILKIIDTVVIDEIRKIDLFGLDNMDTNTDDQLKRKMESGLNYQLLLNGFSNILIYMYPVFKNLSTDKLLQVQSGNTDAIPSDQLQQYNIALKDTVLTSVLQNFPTLEIGYSDNQKIVDTDGTDILTKNTINDFIKKSKQIFVSENETSNNKYLAAINNASFQSDKESYMLNYIKEFQVYIDGLFETFIRQEFAPLNPRSTQYFIFDKSYMQPKITTFFQNAIRQNIISPDFDDKVISVCVETLLEGQKKKFINSFFDFNNLSNVDRSLREVNINKHISDCVQRISTQMNQYDFKLANYSKYIIQKLSEDSSNNNLSTQVFGAIENIITQIDYEVNVQNGLNTKSMGEEAMQSRYVSVENFVTNLDEYKFNNLYVALHPDLLQELVSTLNPAEKDTQLDTFGDSEYALNNATTLFTMTIITLIPAYSLYALNTWNGMKNTNMSNQSQKGGAIDAVAILQNEMIWSSVIKLGIPLAGCFLLIAIFSSYIARNKANIEFNRERMLENTSEIKRNVDDLQKMLHDLRSTVSIEHGANLIKDTTEINEEKKQELYKKLREILIGYDRCNYIIGANKQQIPFPYAEVLANGAMCTLIVGVIAYAIYKFAPMNRIIELKDLYEYRELSYTLANDPGFIQEILGRFTLHKIEVQNVTFVVKAIAALAVIVFMILYSITIISTNSTYKNGLYTSGYYAEKQCCDNDM